MLALVWILLAPMRYFKNKLADFKHTGLDITVRHCLESIKFIGHKLPYYVLLCLWRLLLSANNMCNQFGPRSGPTECWS